MRSALSSEREGAAKAANETAASKSGISLVIALVSSPQAGHSASGGCKGQATALTPGPSAPTGANFGSAGTGGGSLPPGRAAVGAGGRLGGGRSEFAATP